MSVSDWTTTLGFLQGDISYDFKKALVTDTYVDFELTAFGENWYGFDISFEYREDSRYPWQTNASIIASTS